MVRLWRQGSSGSEQQLFPMGNWTNVMFASSSSSTFLLPFISPLSLLLRTVVMSRAGAQELYRVSVTDGAGSAPVRRSWPL